MKTNPIIAQAAAAYAWELGRSDHPSLDECPYNPARSAALHAAYWQGWRAVSPNGAAENERKSAA